MKNNINFFNLPSNIYIKDITKNINEFLPKKLPKKICAKISLGIHFASIRQIQTLNAKFRNKNTPTDVLSFPIYKSIISIKKNTDAEINLGDIFICTEVAKAQAKIHNQTILSEINFLALHGVKHLIGIHHKE